MPFIGEGRRESQEQGNGQDLIVSLIMTSSMALANEGLFELTGLLR